jgi:hypothetical protein
LGLEDEDEDVLFVGGMARWGCRSRNRSGWNE